MENNDMTTEETNRREFEEWFYHVKNDSTLHCEKVIAWEAWQAARDEKTAARILLPRLHRQASKLRKSSRHNALHDLHIIECAISTLEELDNQPTSEEI